VRKLCQEARDTSLGLLSSCLFFMEFRLDASRCVVTWVTRSLMPAVLNVHAGRICPAGRRFPTSALKDHMSHLVVTIEVIFAHNVPSLCSRNGTMTADTTATSAPALLISSGHALLFVNRHDELFQDYLHRPCQLNNVSSKCKVRVPKRKQP